jgi:hypothetical protein
MIRQRLARSAPALVKPYDRWLSEDYFIFHVRESANHPLAADFTRRYGAQIAQVVRGDAQQLSERECAEVLNSQASYYAATSPSLAGTLLSLRQQHTQLLEFRHYDELLDGVYDSRGHRRGGSPSTLTTPSSS